MSFHANGQSGGRLKRRQALSNLFAIVCRLATWSAVLLLGAMLFGVVIDAFSHRGQVEITAYFEAQTPQPQRDAVVAEIVAVAEDHPEVVSVEALKDGTTEANAVLIRIRTNDSPEYRNSKVRQELKSTLGDIANLSFDSNERVRGLTWDFLTRYPSVLHPEKSGILPGIWGSVWLVLLTACFAVPVGVGAAVYLEEYAEDGRLNRFVKLNLSNLAGVPSVVYGILGFTVFVRFFGREFFLPGTGVRLLPLGSTIIAGALTLGLLVLPIVIVSAQEALKSVPSSIRTASLALGATKWQTIWRQVLPASIPGIATGVILSLSRAIGETAPIVVIGALMLTRRTPGGIESPSDLVSNPGALTEIPFDSFTTMPVQIYNWISESRDEYYVLAAAGILVLLITLVAINSVAIVIRNHFQKKLNW